ncbi:2-amino-4-hydroxy-6-hydroxymethyldihydropteridine diphosphokinase [Sphingomonas sp. C3-2]|uniref:2-amino-4-hydroxy-6- hydroxymethyldihydropteridine diphosphokinase n=1 Tax=Sphingomonas sp. C3-2 TaxID=3062169 RepID=UPI00294B3021|nr:2-amino-4-hydroxy-6-hydroxymethyldihydropteridine diphosphokinase [Sphingomonas sp. C3-2]WOK37277.1 2-amino-4-hydroxy-6-hydroxymethyldihydropteridine diphosphokinase [Sphingomonas sp. C3-2]
MDVTLTSYAIALGSNRAFKGYHKPRHVLAAAIAALRGQGITILALSPIMETAPIGPSSRKFANGAALIETRDTPDALLRRLKALERSFGRRAGQRWGARTLDLDIILWSGGAWRSPGLIIPHRLYAERLFVLAPLAHVAPRWRDPRNGRHVLQNFKRLERKTPVDRSRPSP